MVGFILGIIVIIGTIVIKLYLESDKDTQRFGKPILLGGIILSILCISFSCFTSVKTGSTGVITTFGKVEDKTFDAGIHLKAPWQKVIEMDNRVQIQDYELNCFSSDIQEVTVTYRVNYQIDKANAQSIYKNLGPDYATTILFPRVQEAVKSVIARYTAETLISNREHLAEAIEDILTADAAQYNIQIVTTAISNLDFSDAFTNAVEAKQVAEQNKLKAQTEQSQKTMEQEQEATRNKIAAEAAAEVAKTKANADAEVAKIAAEADLEVQKINADAAEYTGLKEAAKNKVLSENLNEALLQYYYIQQWNGSLPTVTSGENSGVYFGIDSIK